MIKNTSPRRLASPRVASAVDFAAYLVCQNMFFFFCCCLSFFCVFFSSFTAATNNDDDDDDVYGKWDTAAVAAAQPSRAATKVNSQ